MGSIIEVFPRGSDPTRANAARAWRAASVRADDPPRARVARLDDLASIRALQHAAQPAVPAMTLRQFESHRRAFLAGQIVVERGGALLAAASSLIVRWEDHAIRPDWNTITGQGTFTTHDPAGGTLHVDDISINPEDNSADVALRFLVQAQRRLCRTLNLRRIILAARIPGYDAFERDMSPDDYTCRVVWGDLPEANVRAPLALGFQYCGIARGYRPADQESRRHAALLVWLNPVFTPPQPPANVERPRKCA